MMRDYTGFDKPVKCHTITLDVTDIKGERYGDVMQKLFDKVLTVYCCICHDCLGVFHKSYNHSNLICACNKRMFLLTYRVKI